MSEEPIKTETVCCDLCGSDDYERILLGKDMLHGLEGTWPVVRCRECGLIFTNPRPAQESLGYFYPESYGPHKTKRPKRMTRRWRLHQWALRYHWNYPPPAAGCIGKWLSWPMIQWTYLKSRNFDLFPYEGQGRLLDYGCGSGGYLSQMHDRGWHVTGMDMSTNGIEICRQRGFEAYVGSSPREQFDPETFDVVTMWHVLEHVPSPTDTLEQLRTILKPHGKLVIGIPNIGCLTAQWFGNCWFALDLPRHLTHFGKKTVTKMLDKTGFEVEKIRAQNHGQTTQPSLRYLTREKDCRWCRFLSRYKRIGYVARLLTRLKGEPEMIVVHARKV